MTFNLQAIIRKSTVNIQTEFDRISYIAQNIANMNTNGYKGVRFEDVIEADGSVKGIERVDMSTGPLMVTSNPLDVAIDGAGFIPVTTQSGEIRYTRDGSFMTNKDGMLITKNGDLVGSGIFIDSAAEKIEIRPNGDVYSYKTKISKPNYEGTIPLVQFANPEGLQDVGGNNFATTPECGNIKLVEDHKSMKQHYIERTNVNLTNEVYQISRTNASILASSKLMIAVDKMYSQAMNIVD